MLYWPEYAARYMFTVDLLKKVVMPAVKIPSSEGVTDQLV